MLILRAAHLPPALVVTAVTAGLAIGVGMAGARMAVLITAAVLGQLSVGWSNDWLDAKRGADTGRADKPVAAGALGARTVRRAALLSLGGAVIASAFLGPVAGGLHVAAVAIAWAYNLWLKASPLSMACYLLSFAALPAVVTLAADQGVPAWWAVVAAASFGGGVHLANALPDIAADRDQGIRGLPQIIGERSSLLASVLLLGAGALAALLGPRLTAVDAQTSEVSVGVLTSLIGVGLLLGAVVILGLRGRRLAAFRMTMLIGLVVVGLLVAQGGQIAG